MTDTATRERDALSENTDLLTTCAVLGALSLIVVFLGRAIPPREFTSPTQQVATAPPRVEKPTPLPETRPIVATPPRPSQPKPKVEAPAPSEPAPAEQPPEKDELVPPPPPQMPPESAPPPVESPRKNEGVSEAPAVSPEAASPLDQPAAVGPKAERLRPGEQVERFEDGTVKARWQTDSKGQRSGPYTEFHKNGKVAIKAIYKAGKLDGTLNEADPAGHVVRRATYRNGLLHGDLLLADASGKIVAHETWFDGKLIYTKSQDLIERKLAEIASEPLDGPAGAKQLDFEPFAPVSQIKALRRLRAYRYLCDVPYDVTLSRPYSELCTAAAKLLEIVGHLDHHPERPPGVPDSLFVPGSDGLAHGNLHEHSERRGEVLLLGGVDMWIFDSDQRNIREVGHRRWSLDPRMKEVAYGVSGKFTVMYAHDTARDAHARDFVAYPSRGLFPISYLVKDSAWSCAFDSDRFRLGDDAKVEVRPVDDRLRKGEPVELRDVTVENKIGFAGGNAMIFRPEVTVAAGARYWVTITGVTDLEGKPVAVEYLVEFMRG